MTIKSHSQAGQDRFALEVLGCPVKGTFLDIGANNPIDINNTYMLEQGGWRGLLIDNSDESARACMKVRKSPFLLLDAAGDVNWYHTLEGLGRTIDYLSLDVDEVTLQVLKKLPLDSFRFRALTIEHDAYRFGEERRAEMIAILKTYGYDVLCADVCDHGMSFEIWAVDPKLVDMKLAERFRRNHPIEWQELFQ